MDTTTTQEHRPTNISRAHCQSCGSTSPDDISDLYDTEGYTRCCNERVIDAGNGTSGRGAFGWYESIPSCADSGDCYHS